MRSHTPGLISADLVLHLNRDPSVAEVMVDSTSSAVMFFGAVSSVLQISDKRYGSDTVLKH